MYSSGELACLVTYSFRGAEGAHEPASGGLCVAGVGGGRYGRWQKYGHSTVDYLTACIVLFSQPPLVIG